jgi:hypothetical protein
MTEMQLECQVAEPLPMCIEILEDYFKTSTDNIKAQSLRLQQL